MLPHCCRNFPITAYVLFYFQLSIGLRLCLYYSMDYIRNVILGRMAGVMQIILAFISLFILSRKGIKSQWVEDMLVFPIVWLVLSWVILLMAYGKFPYALYSPADTSGPSGIRAEAADLISNDLFVGVLIVEQFTVVAHMLIAASIRQLNDKNDKKDVLDFVKDR